MSLVYHKLLSSQPICNVLYKVFSSVYFLSVFFYESQDELEHWRKKKPLPQAKIKIGTYHVVLKNAKTSPKKLTLTVVEMQLLPKIEKTDSKEEISCLKWTKKW